MGTTFAQESCNVLSILRGSDFGGWTKCSRHPLGKDLFGVEVERGAGEIFRGGVGIVGGFGLGKCVAVDSLDVAVGETGVSESSAAEMAAMTIADHAVVLAELGGGLLAGVDAVGDHDEAGGVGNC